MKDSIYLDNFHIVLPRHRTDQADLNRWLSDAHREASRLQGLDPQQVTGLEKYQISPEEIGHRMTEVGEIDRDWSAHRIYQLAPGAEHGVDIGARQRFFGERALEVFGKIYNERKIPEHLVHVTCTGYVSPSAPQLHFANHAEGPAITHAYHMGCYAALPAVRMAASFVGSAQSETVDVVHTEMCGLHMDPGTHTAEQMIVQSLFADGHVAYQLSRTKPKAGYRVLLVKEKLIPESAADMRWIPGAFGMQMGLSRDVPTKIALGLGDFIESVCAELGIEWEELKEQSLFAVHPGGPKILRLAAELLQVNEDKLRASKEILLERGNMSSATLPHIWQRMLTQETSEKYVVSLAFGPGLTIFGSVFERVRA